MHLRLFEIGIIFLNKMKIFLPIFILTLVTSCASIDTNRVAPGYVQAFNAIKQLILGFENNIQPEVISNIPYASMLVRIGNGPEALMILESVNNDRYSWISADGVYLVIQDGIIIKTHGLTNNLTEKLMASQTWQEDLYDNLEYVSYNSYSLPTLNNLKVISTYSLKSKTKINLMFEIKNLRLIEETLTSSEIAWSEINQYWVDESNFVWKSEQNISPRLPTIYYEVTKKPR